MLKISTGNTRKQTEVKEITPFNSFKEFAEYMEKMILSAPISANKDESKWISPVFLPLLNTPYNEQPNSSAYLLFVDLDKGLPASIPAALSRLNHILYRTFTGGEHYRLVVELTPDTATSLYSQLYSEFRKLFSLDVDRSGKSHRRIIYLPTGYHDTPPDQRILSIVTDQRPFIPILPPPPPPSATPPSLHPRPDQLPTTFDLRCLDQVYANADPRPRDVWFSVMCGVRHLFVADPALGWESFSSWASSSTKYDPINDRIMFFDLRPVRSNAPSTTLASLLHLYVPPTSFQKDALVALLSALPLQEVTPQQFHEWSTSSYNQDLLRLVPHTPGDLNTIKCTIFPRMATRTLAKSDINTALKSMVSSLHPPPKDEEALIHYLQWESPLWSRYYYDASMNKVAILLPKNELDQSLTPSTGQQPQNQSVSYIETAALLMLMLDSPAFLALPAFSRLFGASVIDIERKEVSALLEAALPKVNGIVFLPGASSVVEYSHVKYLNLYRQDMVPVPTPVSKYTPDQQLMVWAHDAIYEFMFPLPKDRAILHYIMGESFLHPAKRPHWFVLIQSVLQGVGKSLIADGFRVLLGKSNTRALSSRDMADKSFSGHRGTAVLYTIDDQCSSDPRFLDAIKSQVTEDQTISESKYKDSKEVDNYGRFFITVNNLENIEIDLNDRRAAIWVIEATADQLKDFISSSNDHLTPLVSPALMGTFEPYNRAKMVYALFKQLVTAHPGVLAQHTMDKHKWAVATFPDIGQTELPETSGNVACRQRAVFMSKADALASALIKDNKALALPPIFNSSTFIPMYAELNNLCTASEAKHLVKSLMARLRSDKGFTSTNTRKSVNGTQGAIWQTLTYDEDQRQSDVSKWATRLEEEYETDKRGCTDDTNVHRLKR